MYMYTFLGSDSTSSNIALEAIVVPVVVVVFILAIALFVVVVVVVWWRRGKTSRMFVPVRLTDVDQEEEED